MRKVNSLYNCLQGLQPSQNKQVVAEHDEQEVYPDMLFVTPN